ncbi:transcriptional regulator CtsR [Orenia metallireducens]|jgi:transcriptional regulator CtsR|uniref:Transcriptional regulator CtsR n=1 Tax=Orenia metallireducens TaxID=1413210 RepID=A0A285H8Y0_9FIRM|nr:CtsR family transcriptional regulator [Orenia metallireducens]PRX26171.1 transcriptional regulator CtsR [Orenia metallireducens]SNY32114.1 transcriptional regulator CtsR [Orenia metallireducens]
MKSLSDNIEDYIKSLLEANSTIKIQRNKLADKFKCVPSQINYVLKTRFSVERGYIIESYRGGNGYIKITKLSLDINQNLINRLYNIIGNYINQKQSFSIIERLFEEDIISFSEKSLLKTMVNRDSIGLSLPARDKVRARLLKNVLETLLREKG